MEFFFSEMMHVKVVSAEETGFKSSRIENNRGLHCTAKSYKPEI